MKRFLCILGGTGFSLESPRLKAAIPFMKFLKEELEYTAITSGMGIEEISKGRFEREYVAQLLEQQNISPDRIVVGRGGDHMNRNTRDDILQILNAVPWESVGNPELVFLTEGWLHAFRVKIYCRAQIPAGRTAVIKTMNCGPTDWNRRLKEIRSTAKCLWWLLTR